MSGDSNPHGVGAAYRRRLTDDDLRLLVAGRPGDTAAEVGRLRANPELIEARLGDPAVFDAVFARQPDHPPVPDFAPPAGRRAQDAGAGPEPLLSVASPLLVFAVAVYRAHRELGSLTSVPEWVGPRQRIPVFAAHELRDMVDAPLRRLFLAELLASYTRVASGSVLVRTRKGLRRHRYSELDLTRLVSLLDVLPEAERPGLYRRLGDLALFLTGVFPDHAASRAFRPVDVRRLAAAVGAGSGTDGGELEAAVEVRGPVGLLEHLGGRWYRLAVEGAGRPLVGTLPAVETVADRFADARRVLNFVTDRYLFPFRARWFPRPEPN